MIKLNIKNTFIILFFLFLNFSFSKTVINENYYSLASLEITQNILIDIGIQENKNNKYGAIRLLENKQIISFLDFNKLDKKIRFPNEAELMKYTEEIEPVGVDEYGNYYYCLRIYYPACDYPNWGIYFTINKNKLMYVSTATGYGGESGGIKYDIVFSDKNIKYPKNTVIVRHIEYENDTENGTSNTLNIKEDIYQYKNKKFVLIKSKKYLENKSKN